MQPRWQRYADSDNVTGRWSTADAKFFSSLTPLGVPCQTQQSPMSATTAGTFHQLQHRSRLMSRQACRQVPCLLTVSAAQPPCSTRLFDADLATPAKPHDQPLVGCQQRIFVNAT